MAPRVVTYSATEPTDFSLEPRPREKLTRMGAQSLSDAELLAILLGSGSSDHSPTVRAHEF
jgi:DNA repair proteins